MREPLLTNTNLGLYGAEHLQACIRARCLSTWWLNNSMGFWKKEMDYSDPFQRSFRSGYATETALPDDLRREIDMGSVSLLISLSQITQHCSLQYQLWYPSGAPVQYGHGRGNHAPLILHIPLGFVPQGAVGRSLLLFLASGLWCASEVDVPSHAVDMKPLGEVIRFR